MAAQPMFGLTLTPEQQIQKENEARLMQMSSMSPQQQRNYLALKAGEGIGQGIFGKTEDPRLQQATMQRQIYNQALQEAGGNADSPEFYRALSRLSARVPGMEAFSQQAAQQAKALDTTGAITAREKANAKAEEAKAALLNSLSMINRISDKDIKNSIANVDYTQGEWRKLAGGIFNEKALTAQTKIQGAAIQQTLNQLPKGAASDKDVALALSTFPGYSSERALRNWIEETKTMLQKNYQIISKDPNAFGGIQAAGTTQAAPAAAPGAAPAAGGWKVISVK